MEKVIALFAISRPVISSIVGASGEPTRPDTISPTASGYAQGSPLTGVLLPGKKILGTNRCARLRLLMLGFLAFFNVLAQTPPVITPPPAFKNMQPAAGECKRQDAAPQTAPKPAKADTVRPDLSCAIAPTELSALLKRPDTVLADIRPAADFAAFHINGAMNLTATELRSKRFLKTKTVVLIGNGQAERVLYADCARLKASGFKQTKVLRGGLPVWLSSGQTVLGRPPDLTKTGLLEPVELWAEARFDANLVLVSSNRKDLLHDLPSATTIPDASFAALQTAIKQHGKKPLAAVVLVASAADSQANLISVENGVQGLPCENPQNPARQALHSNCRQNPASDSIAQSASLANLRKAILPVPLLAYTGTTEAYSRQLAQQNAIWEALAHGPKKPRCRS